MVEEGGRGQRAPFVLWFRGSSLSIVVLTTSLSLFRFLVELSGIGEEPVRKTSSTLHASGRLPKSRVEESTVAKILLLLLFGTYLHRFRRLNCYKNL